MRKIVTASFVAILAAGLAGGIAQADPGADVDVVGVLQASTPQTVASRAAPVDGANSISRGSQEFGSKGRVATVPLDPERGIKADLGGARIEVRLPQTGRLSSARTERASIVSYASDAGFRVVPLPQEDGSLQINTVILHEGAPTSYAYDVDVSGAVRTEPFADGGVAFLDASGSFVAGIAPPWAKDAKGVAVPTKYDVVGGKVVQIVEHDSRYAYPIVADPWLGRNLFSYVSTKVRPPYKGLPVFTMELSGWGQLVYRGTLIGPLPALGGYQVMTTNGWQEVISRQPRANTISVKQQYVCHVRYGYGVYGSGWRWDLELARPRNDAWTRQNPLRHRCNW